MPQLMNGDKILFTSGHVLFRVKCYPPLKRESAGEVRPGNFRMPEKVRIPIHDLNGALPAVLFVPFHVEDRRPESQRARKLHGQARVRGGESDSQVHMRLFEDLITSVARR